MRITDLNRLDESGLQQAAQLLVKGFQEFWPNAWPNQERALEEVQAALDPERICRAALSQSGQVLGWIGGIPEYDGKAWELHPLVVDPEYQRQGIGSSLVRDLEDQVRLRGAVTIYLGSDDESGLTSLGGQDLYPDVLGQLTKLRNLRSHPYQFYQKLGYSVVGVIPDANGFGKPDIILARRIQQAE